MITRLAVKWKTKFTEVFSTRLPIMGAPMADVSGGLLAAETTRAGALGFIAAGHNGSEEELSKQVDIFRNLVGSEAPLCLGFIGHSAFKDDPAVARFRRVMEQHQPQVVQFFAPALVNLASRTNVDLCLNDYHAKVLCQVGSVEDARAALGAGASGLIAQGTEAGGHGLRREIGNGTFSLASRVAAISGDIPVIAAGGVVDARGLVAALALGCDGVCLGTRLWASQEAMGNDKSKQVLASPDTEPDSCIRTAIIDRIANSYRPTPWPYPYDSSGIVRNDISAEWDGKEDDLDAVMEEVALKFKKASKEGDLSVAQVYSGEGIGNISSIDPAYDILVKIDEEAQAVLASLPNMLEQ